MAARMFSAARTLVEAEIRQAGSAPLCDAAVRRAAFAQTYWDDLTPEQVRRFLSHVDERRFRTRFSH